MAKSNLFLKEPKNRAILAIEQLFISIWIWQPSRQVWDSRRRIGLPKDSLSLLLLLTRSLSVPWIYDGHSLMVEHRKAFGQFCAIALVDGEWGDANDWRKGKLDSGKSKGRHMIYIWAPLGRSILAVIHVGVSGGSSGSLWASSTTISSSSVRPSIYSL